MLAIYPTYLLNKPILTSITWLSVDEPSLLYTLFRKTQGRVYVSVTNLHAWCADIAVYFSPWSPTHDSSLQCHPLMGQIYSFYVTIPVLIVHSTKRLTNAFSFNLWLASKLSGELPWRGTKIRTQYSPFALCFRGLIKMYTIAFELTELDALIRLANSL